MSDNAALDTDRLPVTQYLILEALAARWRTGGNNVDVPVAAASTDATEPFRRLTAARNLLTVRGPE